MREVSLRFPCVSSGIQELSLNLLVSQAADFRASGVFVDD